MQVLPKSIDEKLQNAQIEAIADAITNAALAITMEGRVYAEDAISQNWMDRQAGKVEPCLKHLSENINMIPLIPENMYMFLVTDEPGNPWMDNEKLADIFRERAAEYGGMIAEAREQITDPSLVVDRPLEVVFIEEPWHKGRVILIGDAAHGTTPHYGQGSAQAVEDAVVLAEECGRATSIDALFNTFMERRYERCKFVKERSAEAGQMDKKLTSADQAQRRQEMIDMIAKPI